VNLSLVEKKRSASLREDKVQGLTLRMNLLLIDSVHTELTVAVAIDGKIVNMQTCAEQRRHDKNINTLIKTCLQKACLQFSNLSAIAVVVGPGSWTGIRVGLSVVKSYSYALDIPIIELTDEINLATAMKKYDEKKFTDVFKVKPFYNGSPAVINGVNRL
jgi:tRNA threonylcarbamoyl adenosine modification protein YeaZ